MSASPIVTNLPHQVLLPITPHARPTPFQFDFTSLAMPNTTSLTLNKENTSPESPKTSPTGLTIPQQPVVLLQTVPKRKNLRKRPIPLALNIPKEISSLSNAEQLDFTPPPKLSTTTPPNTATEVTRQVYLGSEQDARNPHLYSQTNITQVLSIVSSDGFTLPSCIKNVKQLHIKLNDTSGEDILSHFEQAIEFISGNRTGSTLIHCRAGISRSSTIVMAFLMHSKRWSLNQAFTYVKEKRKCVAPNFGFLGQLQKFEEELGTGSPTPGLL